MRPIKLELENFGIYRGRHELDFSGLNFFVIKGRTGAGKSTLIDALCYALYGMAPRYGERIAHRYLISKGQNYMHVALEFSVKGKRYRIEREYEVLKSKGKQKEEGRSEFRFYEEGKPKELRGEELKNYLKDILRLDYKTFTKVLLLPQNQFDRFLKPTEQKERREILNSLLGFSTLFASLKELIQEEYRELSGKLESLEFRFLLLESAKPEKVYSLEQEILKFDREYRELSEKKAQKQTLLGKCKERDTVNSELNNTRESLSRLLQKEEYIKALRNKLELALELLPYLPKVEEYERIKQQEDRYIKEKERKELELKENIEERLQVEEEFRNLEKEFRRLEEYSRESSQLSQTLQLFESYKKQQREEENLEKELSSLEGEILKESKTEEEKRQKFLKVYEIIKELQEKVKAYEETGVEEKVRHAEKIKEELKRLKELYLEEKRLRTEVETLSKNIEELKEKLDKAHQEHDKLKEELKRREELVEELKRYLWEEGKFILEEMKLRELLSKVEELERIQKEKEQIKDRREELLKSLEILKGELSELQSKRLELYAIEIRSNLKEGSTCPVCGSIVEKLHSEELEEDIRALFDRQKETQERCSSLEREIFATEAQLSSLTDIEQKLMEELQGLDKKELERSLEQVRETLKTIKDKRALLQEKEREISQIKEKQEKLSKELENLKSSETNTREKYSSKNSLLERTEEEIRRILGRLSGEPEVVSEEIKKIENAYQEYKSLREREREYFQKLEKLQKELAESEKRLEGLKGREKNLIAQLEREKEKLLELEQEIKNRTGEIPSLALEKKVERRIEELSRTIKNVQERYANTGKYLREIKTKEANLLSDIKNIENFLQNLKQQEEALAVELYELEGKLGSLEEAKKYTLSQEEIRSLQQEIEAYQKQRHNLESRLKELENKMNSFEDLPSTEEVEKEIRELEEEIFKNRELYGKLRKELEKVREELKEKELLKSIIQELSRSLSLYERLKSDFTDNQFPEFVSQLMLRKVVDRANYYLFKFTAGQFTFEVVEGDLQVLDHSTGYHRIVSSLSGGESFLASLSLAFAVADILSQNAPLESLFIDEGFGSLDRETREQLSEFFQLIQDSTDRMVGIITHVEDIADRFAQRIEIEKKGSSAHIKVIY